MIGVRVKGRMKGLRGHICSGLDRLNGRRKRSSAEHLEQGLNATNARQVTRKGGTRLICHSVWLQMKAHTIVNVRERITSPFWRAGAERLLKQGSDRRQTAFMKDTACSPAERKWQKGHVWEIWASDTPRTFLWMSESFWHLIRDDNILDPQQKYISCPSSLNTAEESALNASNYKSWKQMKSETLSQSRVKESISMPYLLPRALKVHTVKGAGHHCIIKRYIPCNFTLNQDVTLINLQHKYKFNCCK